MNSSDVYNAIAEDGERINWKARQIASLLNKVARLELGSEFLVARVSEIGEVPLPRGLAIQALTDQIEVIQAELSATMVSLAARAASVGVKK